MSRLLLIALGAFLLLGTFLMARGGESVTRDKDLLDLINAERKKEGRKPLVNSPLLSKVAKAHAENMAKQKKPEHNLDGKTPFDRLRAAGYAYFRAGENVAAGDARLPLPVIVKGWMDSEGHRKNILQEEFTESGIGFAIEEEEGWVYVGQVFGKPKRK